MSKDPNLHAVVIGGSIAGLLAARVLADHTGRVTIIERDHLPDGPQPRKGVPQASHVHVLLAKGLSVLDALLPGFSRDLAANGAIPVAWGRDARTFNQGNWLPAFDGGPSSFLCSRDLLEYCVRKRVLALANVEVLQATDVTGIEMGANGFARGVSIRRRADLLDTRVVEADVIVDASGRSSKLPEWLQADGFPAPEETAVNAFLGYSSCLFRKPKDFAGDWKVVLVRDRDVTHARGAGIYAIENGLWQVNLGASGKAYPPIDHDGFMQFLRDLPVPDLYDALQHAEPVTGINGYRRTENRWRHYEKLTAMPHNVVAMGDAVCAFNPVYGQGMSVAALDAQVLDGMLRSTPTTNAGFSLRFQRQLAQVLQTPWLMATGEDFRTPLTEGGRPSRLTRFSHRYLDRVMAAATHDASLHRAFMEVLQLLKPPSSLFAPAIALKVLWHGRSKPTETSTPKAALAQSPIEQTEGAT